MPILSVLDFNYEEIIFGNIKLKKFFKRKKMVNRNLVFLNDTLILIVFRMVSNF